MTRKTDHCEDFHDKFSNFLLQNFGKCRQLNNFEINGFYGRSISFFFSFWVVFLLLEAHFCGLLIQGSRGTTRGGEDSQGTVLEIKMWRQSWRICNPSCVVFVWDSAAGEAGLAPDGICSGARRRLLWPGRGRWLREQAVPGLIYSIQ